MKTCRQIISVRCFGTVCPARSETRFSVVNFLLGGVAALSLLQASCSRAAVVVTNIATGSYFSLFIKSDGSLWAMGANGSGQLGDGTFDNVCRPEQVVGGGVIAAAGGSGHSLFLKSDGSIWAMGDNNFGQLGDGVSTATNVPQRVVSHGGTAVACGYYHSLFLKSDGSLWTMGYNYYGQLGNGTFTNTNTPQEIVSNGVVAIAAGKIIAYFSNSTAACGQWVTILQANLVMGPQPTGMSRN